MRALRALILIGLGACTSSTSNVAGHYYWGAEVVTFQPWARNDRTGWSWKTSVLQPLRDKAAELSRRKEPYSAVFVVANATLEPQPAEGFAADYNGLYRFNEVTHLNEVSPSDCLPQR